MKHMRASAFVDTNILLYAASTDETEASKRKQARQILSLPNWGLSVQVLQELYVNLIRPTRRAMSHDNAVLVIKQLLRRPMVTTDEQLLLEALSLKQRFQVSYWDAAIIAAGLKLGANVLYSEDLNHGQNYDGICVENPFSDA